MGKVKWLFVAFHLSIACLFLIRLVDNVEKGAWLYAIMDSILTVCNIGLFTLFLGDK